MYLEVGRAVGLPSQVLLTATVGVGILGVAHSIGDVGLLGQVLFVGIFVRFLQALLASKARAVGLLIEALSVGFLIEALFTAVTRNVRILAV